MLKVWEIHRKNGDILSIISETRPNIRGKVTFVKWLPAVKNQWPH